MGLAARRPRPAGPQRTSVGGNHSDGEDHHSWRRHGHDLSMGGVQNLLSRSGGGHRHSARVRPLFIVARPARAPRASLGRPARIELSRQIRERMMASPDLKFDTNTELSSRRTGMSFPRTRMTADRTLMSVIRPSLSLIGFGFTIAQ